MLKALHYCCCHADRLEQEFVIRISHMAFERRRSKETVGKGYTTYIMQKWTLKPPSTQDMQRLLSAIRNRSTDPDCVSGFWTTYYTLGMETAMALPKALRKELPANL